MEGNRVPEQCDYEGNIIVHIDDEIEWGMRAFKVSIIIVEVKWLCNNATPNWREEKISNNSFTIFFTQTKNKFGYFKYFPSI